jgi:hypothetical protein
MEPVPQQESRVNQPGFVVFYASQHARLTNLIPKCMYKYVFYVPEGTL